MGEWKRILSDPGRIVFLIVVPVISLIISFMGWTDSIRLRDVRKIIEEKRLLSATIEKYRGVSQEEASAAISAERANFSSVSVWTRGWSEGTIEEMKERLAEYPDLLVLLDAEDYPALRSEIGRLTKPLGILFERIEYWKSYPEYLRRIGKQAEEQSQTSIYGDIGSFTYRNLIQTAEQFRKLQEQNITAEYGNYQAVEGMLDFRLADYLYLTVIVFVVLTFLEERKKGLWSTIRSCPGGRMKLGFVRLGILGATAVVYTFLLYDLNVIAGLLLTGGWSDLANPLQSIARFRTCPLAVTISQWLFLYSGQKIMSGVLIGLLFWLILGRISSIQFSFAVLGGVLIGEYLLFALLPVQSFLNPLKYVNLFSYVHLSDIYTQYLNMNLFGYPVGIRPLMLWLMPVLLCVLLCGVLRMQTKRYPEGNRDLLGKLAGIWRRVADKVRINLPVFAMEGYKNLVPEYAIVLLLITWWLAPNLSYMHRTADSAESQWYRAYLTDAEGPAAQALDDYLTYAWSQVPQEGEMSASLSEALSQMEERVRSLRERATEKGYQPWLINESVYTGFYGPDARQEQRQNAAVALIMLLLCTAGMISYERQSGVMPLIRSLKNGRLKLWHRKWIWSGFLAVIIWILIYSQEWGQFSKICNPETLDATVQNLDMLKDFPIVISIRVYLVFLYGMRLLMLLAAAWVTLYLSSLFSTAETAYWAVFAVIGLPSLLLLIGVEICAFLSPVIPIASAELGISLGNGLFAWIPWALWMMIGIICSIFAKRKWTGAKK